MNKLLAWCRENILFLFTLFLLAFIPLYPKLPLIDVKHVWVYVRIEDFVVLFMLLCWVIVAIRRKLSLRTPLTVPILAFWLVGAMATIHGIVLIFPSLAYVFPNVALLSLLRRIEYMSVFFISYFAMKDKRLFPYFVLVLTMTLLFVSLYGIGQRYFSLPAYLTMNEEFAKGTPLQLSVLSRVSSTFAGHYDLAAYLVLVIPIIVSLSFGYRNWFLKALLFSSACLGLLVLFMTVSRISFFALFVGLGLVLLVQKKKLLIFSIPIMVLIVVFLLHFSPSLLDRFGSTIKEISVVVDAKTGQPVGHIKEVPKAYFENKIVKQEFFTSVANVATSSPSASLIIPYAFIPEQVILLVEPQASTGEDLPQGTGYINLSLSPVVKRIGNFYYERKPNPATGVIEVTTINGDYLLKKASAYDLSFTTRFQAEWPHAIEAFKRNILFGSGYGSVSLAVDNSYLRMLGEVGALGTISFLAIFIAMGVYIRSVWPTIDSSLVKSFIVGLTAGIVGLAINGIFIDVFEASKVAFVLWLLVGTAVALVGLYRHLSFHAYSELKKVATSTYAIIAYLLIVAVLLYSPMTKNYFVGDDFTWFRWVAGCSSQQAITQHCQLHLSTTLKYFTASEGFFYRPGAKIYFLLMYSAFWLNQAAYHTVSLFLHFAVSALVFLLAKKILKNALLATLAGFLFLILTGFSEAVLWISATGFLFTAFFSLASLLFYVRWVEQKRLIWFIGALSFSILSPLFHELGIVTPFLFIVYQWTMVEPVRLKQLSKDLYHRLLFAVIPLYLLVRFMAHSHWLSGDYNYNLFKLPFNAVGNAIGYFSLTLVGPLSLPFYQVLRNILKAHTLVALAVTVGMVVVGAILYRKVIRRTEKREMNILFFGVGFSAIALLPFLGLGNISSRYSYLSAVGMLLVFVYGLHRFYIYTQRHGRDIAALSAALLVSLFFVVHIVELQQLTSDWYEAGETVKRFFVSIQSVYDDKLAQAPLELHFVNVPIRHGDAWVFPVGLPDGLWLVFRNPQLKVYTHNSLDQALSAVEVESKTQRIYIFDNDGKVTQTKKTGNAQ